MVSSTTTPTPTPFHIHNHRPISTCKVIAGVLIFMLVITSMVAIIHNILQKPQGGTQFITTKITLASPEVELKPLPRSVVEWQTIYSMNASIKWQRCAYHFRPNMDFISDPNGPLYHMGWYHLFYQYNPGQAIWGNMKWGHAVSKDLIHWFELPLAMVPDQWYDSLGVMTGSASRVPNGGIRMLYTGNAYDLSQLQCLAYPRNSSDPLLIDWVKYEGNPIIFPPPYIGVRDFRDPSSMWLGPDGKYRMVMGSKYNDTIGCVLVYHTIDFTHFELLDDMLHSVPGTGMWECVDFYPVSMNDTNGFDMSDHDGSIAKYVLKQSGDEDRHDWYAIGSYDPFKDKFYPDDHELDLGIGLRYDYGKFYASKTFYDPSKKRRILWGYVGETDTVQEDIIKGWANMLNVPRTVVLDTKTQTNVIQWPVEEVKTLRSKKHKQFKNVELPPGSLVPLKIGSTTQMDMYATFKVNKASLKATKEADVFNCTTSEGAAMRGKLGPFGVVLLADAAFSEQTSVYYYIAKNPDGTSRTYFCADESRSSNLLDVGKRVYGSTVPVLHGENYNMRLLVDHSIIESFAQGGRTVITSRVYPTKAIYKAAKLFLFNNATDLTVEASIKIWKMGDAKPKPFPL